MLISNHTDVKYRCKVTLNLEDGNTECFMDSKFYSRSMGTSTSTKLEMGKYSKKNLSCIEILRDLTIKNQKAAKEEYNIITED